MLIDCLFAFLICGAICVIAQIIVDNTRLTPGHVTSIFVVAGVILEFFGLYQYIRKIGRVGASIPICNFGALMMEGVKQLIETQGLLGIVNGVFYITGGVITFCVFLSLVVVIFARAKS